MTQTRRAYRFIVGLALGAGVLSIAGAQTASAQAFGGPWRPHAPLPVIDDQGGPVLTNARVVPILYAADPLLPSLHAYFTALGSSGYLEHAVHEYGVGAVTVAAPVILSDAPPPAMLDTDIAAWLAAQIDAGVLPAEDGNTMFQIVYPASTRVLTGGQYGVANPTCLPFQFEAYPSAGGAAPFSVQPLCEGYTPGSANDVDFRTVTSSTWIANVLANPFPAETPAYASPSWHGSGWAWWTGYGVGQLCLGTLAEATDLPSDLGFRVARVWSNRAARTDRDPCAASGSRDAAYFNAAPDIVGGTIPYPDYAAKGIILPSSGGHVTIPVRLFGDRATGDWTLTATERTDLDFQSPPVLSFAFDEAQGRDGDVRHLTVTRAPAGEPGPASALAFEIASTANGVTHEWLVTVGND